MRLKYFSFSSFGAGPAKFVGIVYLGLVSWAAGQTPHAAIGKISALGAAGQGPPTSEPPTWVVQELAEARDTRQLDRVLAYSASPEGKPWASGVLLEAGEALYDAGCYSRSLEVLEKAWQAALAAQPADWMEHKLVARIAAKLGGLYARIGRLDELRAVLKAMEGRPVEGSETLAFTNLKQAVASMEEFPEHSFKCGPLALGNVFGILKPGVSRPERIALIPSPRKGFSLAELETLGDEIGLKVRAVRAPKGEVPVPAVVHWRAGHYAAITKHDGDRFLIEDPTFQRSIWMQRDAILEESSGLYVIPEADAVRRSWTGASLQEKTSTHGKGAPSQTDTNNQGGSDGPAQCGLPRASFNDFYASLVISDIPLFYTPPVGPAVEAQLTYFDASNYDNATASHGHPGKKWMLSWVRHVEVPFVSPSGGSYRLVRHNGKTETYTSTVDGGLHTVERPGTESLSRISVNGGVGAAINQFSSALPDGSVETYGYVSQGGNPQAFGAVVGTGGTGSRFYLAELADPQGNKLRFQYAAGTAKLKKVIDAIGQETTLHYSDSTDGLGADNPSRRHISAIRDPFGRVVRFHYDAQLRLTRLVDVAGIETTFAYAVPATPDFITSMTTPYGTSQFEKSEASGQTWLTLTDPEGLQEKLVFGFNFNSATLAGRNGTTAVPAETPTTPGIEIANGQAYYGYLYYGLTLYWDKKTMRNFPPGANALNYDKAHQTRWAQQTTSYSVLTGTPSSRRPALSHREWYRYQDQPDPGTVGLTSQPTLRIRRVVNEQGQPADEIHRYEYNSIGHMTRRTDPVGRETTFDYAANGIDLTAVKRKRGGSVETLLSFSNYGHDAPHRPRYVTDAAGRITEHRWNALGQLLETIDPLGHRTVNTYNANGYLEKTERTHPTQPGTLAELRRFFYDPQGRVNRVLESDGYDLDFEYDALNRLTRTTYPDGTTTTATYTALSLEASKDRRNRVTSYEYNANGQPILITDPMGRQTQMEWCSCGSPKTLIDAMGRATRWRYDIAGRVTEKEYVDGSREMYQYQPSTGRLASLYRPRDVARGEPACTYAYTVDGQLALVNYTESATPDVRYTYDAADGRIATMTDGIGTTRYLYRPVDGSTLGAGQLWQVDGPWPDDTITYSHDALGRQTGYGVNTVGETLAFDSLGRVATVTSPLGTFTQTYLGTTARLDSVTYPGGMTATHGYHPVTGDFRLKDLAHTLPGGSQLSRHSYEYDADGSINRWTQVAAPAGINRSWQLDHDLADQLTGVTPQDPVTLVNQASGHAAYTYDNAGNRLSETRDQTVTTAGYDALNRLTSMAAGTTSPLPARDYEWDAENRLTAITYPGTNRRSEFRYDGLDRRMEVIEKAGATVLEQRRFVWDGLRIVEERGANGQTLRRRYLSGGMQVAPTPGGALQGRLFARDPLGSVRHVTTTAGTWLASIDYDAWGRRTTTAGSTDDTSLAFTGHWWHEASGLALAPYRGYDPVQGRWISRDPIGEISGVNLYNYVSNNPITRNDPFGLWQVDIGAAWFFGGVVSFGYNQGRGNFGIQLGIGGGAKFSIDPNDRDSFCFSDGLTVAAGPSISADAQIGYAKAEGAAGISLQAGQSGNIALTAEGKAGVGLPYLPLTIGGSAAAGAYGNPFNGTGGFEGSAQFDSSPSFGIGAMGFIGIGVNISK